MAMIARDFRICRMDMRIACFGTASKVGNQPSPYCCWRQASSNSTTKYGCFRFTQVRWRIVEGQVPILADADKGHINRLVLNQRADASTFLMRIIFAIQVMKRRQGDGQLAHKPLPQIQPKRRRMRDRQADVLVQVKHLHPRPVDPGRGHQRLEELELRRTSGRNEARARLRGEHIDKDARRVRRRRAAHRLPADERLYLHRLAAPYRPTAEYKVAGTFPGKVPATSLISGEGQARQECLRNEQSRGHADLRHRRLVNKRHFPAIFTGTVLVSAPRGSLSIRRPLLRNIVWGG